MNTVLPPCCTETHGGESSPVRCSLVDRFGRAHTYLRLSVTDRCNLRCFYCMPSSGIPLRNCNDILRLEEIERLIRVFASMGVNKVRITGGEPLVRHDLPSLIHSLTTISGIETIAMTTNGVLLKQFAAALRDVGLHSVNISLDTLRPERFERIALRSHYNDVRAGIDAALDCGFQSVKINMVVIGGVNDDELLDFVDFAIERSAYVRFIEYMPFQSNQWRECRFVPYATMKETISGKFTLVPLIGNESHGAIARDFSILGFPGRVGFITSMSNHFCGTCNRLRLMADGSMKTCLFKSPELQLRECLRSGASDNDLGSMIREALELKPEAHPPLDDLLSKTNNNMLEIGG